MEYLIRFVQQHEPFRKPEIDALAELCKINLRWVSYSDAVRRLSLL
jgi:tRNA (guanine10-N2)-methyltransferase